MSNVQLSGLMAAHKKARRAKVERDFHQSQELSVKPWMKADRAGKCYTYRGVEYCYA